MAFSCVTFRHPISEILGQVEKVTADLRQLLSPAKPQGTAYSSDFIHWKLRLCYLGVAQSVSNLVRHEHCKQHWKQCGGFLFGGFFYIACLQPAELNILGSPNVDWSPWWPQKLLIPKQSIFWASQRNNLLNGKLLVNASTEQLGLD